MTNSLSGVQVQAAIESVGVPPRMYSLSVRDSASGGINVTGPDSLVGINNCTVSGNAGQRTQRLGQTRVLGSRAPSNGVLVQSVLATVSVSLSVAR